MSVLVTMRIHGDTQKFRSFMASGDDRITRIRDAAVAGGCLHHRFGVGDGFVVVLDEWESAEAFQRFFEGNSEIPGLMQAAGAEGAPEFTFLDAISTPDQF
jgi:hypothetical protein